MAYWARKGQFNRARTSREFLRNVGIGAAIAKRYLKGWFAADLIAGVPVLAISDVITAVGRDGATDAGMPADGLLKLNHAGRGRRGQPRAAAPTAGTHAAAADAGAHPSHTHTRLRTVLG